MATASIQTFSRKTIAQLRQVIGATQITGGLRESSHRQSLSASGFLHQYRCMSSTNSGRRFNVGILGVGRIGQLHLANVLQNTRFNVQWILDNDMGLLEKTRANFHLDDTPLHHAENYGTLLEDSRLDGVLVLTATPTHTDFSVRALKRGKAVFTEKPAGENIDDVRRCFETAEEHKRPFLVGFNRRFDSTFVQLHDSVRSGSVGTLQYLRLTARDSPKPSYDFLKTCDTTGCNILADMSVHCVDQLVWITQSERPEHIYVMTHAHDETMAEFDEADAIGVLIKYKSGIIASLDTFRESTYGYDIRLEVFGSQGMLLADNPRDSSMFHNAPQGGALPKLYNSFPQRFQESFKGELDHFADCIEGVSTPKVTKQECLLVSEIIDKGLESYRTKMPAYF